MRTFTLVMGTFELEVEESEKKSKNYSAKCKKVGFSVENHSSIDSILYPFCIYLTKKSLRCPRDPVKVIYKGFTLEMEYTIHTYLGVCKEIEFEDNHFLDDLISGFIEKVDKHLETKTMKDPFSVVYEGFTLEVWQKKVLETTLWFGKCNAIIFEEDTGFHYLDTLVRFFQEKVDEYLKPTKIEYQGHKLEISVSKNKFEGYSSTCKEWKTLQNTKEEVVEAFKVRVDAMTLLNIQSLKAAVTEKQDKLEEYLRSQGYRFDTVTIFQSTLLYAIHPDYWTLWSNAEKDFPESKVVFIRQQ